MPRTMLSDEQWLKLQLIMLQIGIYDKSGLRLTVEGILYRMRVGCPWRDLPKEFGKWDSIYKRFNEWSSKGKLLIIFQSLVQNPDMEWVFIDSSFVKAHQNSAGAATDTDEGIGLSKGGRTTKIHLVTDSHGNPVRFCVTAGNVSDMTAAPELLEKVTGEFFVADKGYDSKEIRQQISNTGAQPVIPRKKNSVVGNKDFDWGLYKNRHLVENTFAALKRFRALATRFDKLKRNFEAMLALACIFLWLPL